MRSNTWFSGERVDWADMKIETLMDGQLKHEMKGSRLSFELQRFVLLHHLLMNAKKKLHILAKT